MMSFDEAIDYLNDRYSDGEYDSVYDHRDSNDPYLSVHIGSIYTLRVQPGGYPAGGGWAGKVRAMAGGSGREIPEDAVALDLPDLCDEADGVMRENIKKLEGRYPEGFEQGGGER